MNTDIPEEFLDTPYRKNLWKKAKEYLAKLEQVFDIEEAYLVGSFVSDKKRPADVDFILLLQVAEDDDVEFSVDIAFSPNNTFGAKVVRDTDAWSKERYGERACNIKIK